MIFAVLVAPGCGKKGPLTLEPEKLPMPITDLSVKQLGQNIELKWTFPQYLSDNTSAPDSALIRRISIYQAEKEIEPEKFRKKADLLKRLDLSELTVNDAGIYSLEIPFSIKNLENKRYRFAILYYYGKKRSPISNIEFIETINPVRPIEDLTLTRERKVLKLKWSKPFLNLSNTKIKGISGYRVYRKLEGQELDKPAEFEEISKGNVLLEFFEDTDTGIDATYSYYVTVVSSDNIYSSPSNTATLKLSDIYPPDPPVNLVVFKGKDHMFLTWEKAKDKDFSHYIIYKNSSNSQDGFKPLTGQVTDNFFKDNKVKPRVTYFYYITAVDNKGNESNRSNLVKEKF